MSKEQFKINDLDVLQPLSSDDIEQLEGGLTLAPAYFGPADRPKFDPADRPKDDVVPIYPLPIPCHPYKPTAEPSRLAYPCFCSPYPIKGKLPWCAVIL